VWCFLRLPFLVAPLSSLTFIAKRILKIIRKTMKMIILNSIIIKSMKTNVSNELKGATKNGRRRKHHTTQHRKLTRCATIVTIYQCTFNGPLLIYFGNGHTRISIFMVNLRCLYSFRVHIFTSIQHHDNRTSASVIIVNPVTVRSNLHTPQKLSVLFYIKTCVG
jgi:hypothetical protein